MSLFDELRRRNVFKVGAAYAVATWLLLQIVDVVAPLLELPEWFARGILLLLAVGFPIALLAAWAYELTPEGLKRESEVDRTSSIRPVTSQRLTQTTIVLLLLALGYFAWDKFAPPASKPLVAESPSSVAAPAAGDSEDNALPGEIPEKSVAVLPFVNLSADEEQAYFSDGISEELINVLAQFPGLRVAARTSAFQFKDQNQDIGEIARLLKVRHVLEGSVRRAEDRLRITAQLVEADSGYHLWSDTYDRTLDDVFAIQEEIATAIGEAMRIELALAEDGGEALPQVREAENTTAYEAFLKGRHLINQRGRGNIEAAIDELERAIRLDPDFAPAHAWLAIGWTLMRSGPSTYGDLTQAEVVERATPHAERAMELDPELAATWGAKALLAIGTARFNEAIEYARRALELNPAFVDALTWLSLTSGIIGDYDTTFEANRRILEIDPLSIIGRLNHVSALGWKDTANARRMGEALREQSPWAGNTALASLEFQQGNLSEAFKHALVAYAIDANDEFTNTFILRALSNVGLFDEARRFTSTNVHLVDNYQGHYETAVTEIEHRMARDPENLLLLIELADAVHFTGDHERALGLYRQLRERQLQITGADGMLFDPIEISPLPQLRMAWSATVTGDDELAQTLIAGFRRDWQTRQQLDYIGYSDHLAEAVARVIEDDRAAAYAEIQAALDFGFREPAYFNEPALAPLRDDPRLAEIRAELDALVAHEREEVLTVMCENNPIPDTWRPLDATCSGFGTAQSL